MVERRGYRRYVGPLTLAALALLGAWVALGVARTHFAASPDQVFTIDSIWPADQTRDDSWMPMRVAFEHLRDHPDKPVYSQVFLKDRIKFQYPLSSLLVLYVAWSTTALNTISLVMMAVAGVFMVLIFRELLHRMQAHETLAAKPSPAARQVTPLESILLPLLMTATFYPLVWSYRLGQIQTWLIAGFIVLVWCWLKGAKGWAGAIGGLLVLVKPQFGFLLLWGLLRRQWSFSRSFALVAIVGFGVSLGMYSWHQHLDYLNVLTTLSKHGEGFAANQSVNGLLNRLFLTADTRDFRLYYLPAYNPIVYWGTLSTTLLLVILSLAGPIRRKGGTLDLFIASLTCTMASPVAWNHHYGVLLPVYAALFIWSLRRPVFGRWTLAYLCLSYLLVGTFLGAFWQVTMTRWNLVQSYPFAGVVMLLVMMYRLAWVGEPDGAVERPVTAAAELGYLAEASGADVAATG
jgi:hypothetical protein